MQSTQRSNKPAFKSGNVNTKSGGQPVNTKSVGQPQLKAKVQIPQNIEIKVKKPQQYTRLLEEFVYENIMLPNNIPGVQLVFAYQGDILYDEAFGHSNVEENRAASTSNYHRIASVSKAVTVACLDVLVARGKLNLEQLVFKEILTEYNISKNPRLAKVTVQHLIDHDVGIWDTCNSCPMFYWAEKYNVQEVIQMTIDSPKWPLKEDPGSYGVYSNFGYCLLGRVIEKITNKLYINFVREEFNVDVQLAEKTYDKLLPDENTYYSKTMRSAYTMNLSRMDSCAGLLFKPHDLLKLANQIQGNVSQRGSIAGAESLLLKRGDWIMVAFANRRKAYLDALPFQDVYAQFCMEFDVDLASQYLGRIYDGF